jgi:hypothetical protein
MKTIFTVPLILWLAALPAWAALGEYESSIGLDQQALGGAARLESHAAYKLDQITAAHGVMMREFVSPDCKVFAVAWQSHSLPNLQPLLGSYLPQMQQAAQARTQHGGPLVLKRADLVLVSAGRMMGFYGYAYVPSLAPSNFTAEQMR